MQDQNVLFQLKNLRCEYQPNQPVLQIDDLKIKGNQLVFFIGVSGVGKSTLIETLGLMNNTFGKNKEGSATYFSNDDEINLSDFWNQNDTTISEFRANHFSFLFQNNNLMDNLSCGENMCLGQLVNEKTSFEEAKKNVLRAIENLFPNEDAEIIFNKPITDISGGQRQRLTFIRAITSSFKVLFCDEPTGNLDKKTAKILMTQLKNALAEKNRLGIVVSHDLELAWEYGDQIIGITPRLKNGKVSHGEITTTNILQKNTQGLWLDSHGQLITQNWIDKNFFA